MSEETTDEESTNGESTDRVRTIIEASIATKTAVLEDDDLVEAIDEVVDVVVEAFRGGNIVYFCGNGGSAADAQHLSSELSGRFYLDRDPLFAEALHVNTSYLTAVANDYKFDEVYARLIRGKGSEDDVLFCISTSGNSPNIVKAAQAANDLGMVTIGLTGETGGRVADEVKHLVAIPSDDTPRIQETHILVGHIICELVEAELFGSD